MNTKSKAQELLFETVRAGLSPNLSLVHEISELLGLSYDSAYRRIRNEKELTLDELKLLCNHFKISADSLFSLESNNILFKSMAINEHGVGFKDWLLSILNALKAINSCKEKEIIYSAKDIPVFHYFEFPEIFAFKFYFWHKALLPSHQFEDLTLDLDLSSELNDLGRQITMTYNKIPTSELWNEETFNSIIRQIGFCHVSGFLKRKEDVERLCSALEKMIRHLQHQAELGFRFLHGSTADGVEGSYRLYYNEVLLGDNTIYTRMDANQTTYLTYNVINLLTTSDPAFCSQIEKSLKILMQKSMLISSTSAKERSRFFNHTLDKIKELRESFC
ncbi:MAG: hypothetical protein FJY07_09590 [Bacteroidetes bacterium]|nr:hypothetical protein [Bacteroidota bacterium]